MLLSPSTPGGAKRSVVGEILDLTGERLTLRRENGAELRAPADRLLDLKTVWEVSYERSRAAMVVGEWSAADALLADAVRSEKRPWAKRRVVEDLIVVRVALGANESAGELFLALAASDPATPAWRLAPLAWEPPTATTSGGVGRRVALRWLGAANDPVARLLGASWLLGDRASAAAEAELLRLAESDNPRVAPLATAQLWRLRTRDARPDQLALWEEKTRETPEPVRAGPWLVVSRGLLAAERWDEAATAALRLPAFYGDNRPLAAAGLLVGVKATDAAGHPGELRRLVAELQENYPETAAAKQLTSHEATP
ncbi:hypothetical protein [Pseudobythopirellula maris]|uniref:hypothetical protein n=1 Tax=Pseudobythopirellula maris TaxID=2527991 RepID=UPI0018D38E0F|nr:hypothetical protein [Pseudobythopirellula maris]